LNACSSYKKLKLHTPHCNQHNTSNWKKLNNTSITTKNTWTYCIKRLGFKDLLLQMNYTSIAMWWDLVAFQAFIVVTSGKELKVKNFWANNLTTKSKWVVNLFLSLFFINPIFEKHLSSSMLPITMAIDNSISFSH